MKRFLFIFFTALLFINLSNITYASEEVPYSVQTRLPDNQENTSVSYFDLEVVKNKKQTLEIEVFNKSNEPIEVKLDANTGTTNSNGLLVYDGSIDEFDDSLKYNFKDMTSVVTPTLEIEPRSSKVAQVSLTMPTEDFEGTILGGLHFLLKDSSNADEDSGVQIKNNYAYEVAVVLNDKNSTSQVDEEILLNNVHAGIVNERTGLNVEFSNKKPLLITNTEVKGSVYKKGNSEPLYTREETKFSIAPNAKFKFPIMFDDQKLKAGEYIFKGDIKTEHNTFDFEKEFSISKEEAKKTNEEAVETVDDPETSDWKLIAIIISGILLIGLLIIIIYLLIRRKK